MTKVNLFIQMELCAETLEEYLNRRGSSLTQLEYRERLNIALQIIEAIHAIHNDYHLIHRDLSLRNVFIGKDGVIKIGDFGLAIKCKHLIPILASPAALRPVEVLGEEELEGFALNEEVQSEDEGEDEEEHELTHGLGTQTFAAPEQMSNLPYDQKVLIQFNDVYF